MSTWGKALQMEAQTTALKMQITHKDALIERQKKKLIIASHIHIVLFGMLWGISLALYFAVNV